ncbi:hypothetical protein MKZ38_009099 [Zalerion maritima]|uniref:ABC transporter domain-containing protein n=1 Tax=Zalerion maritima TaxID=339359 RepID=A0AAD5WUV5_9PEZI|nr:hypothetical protein MKZ38_009099 [Zalerion maritima]
MRFIKQTWTLTSKTLRIVVLRHPLATFIRAFLLPLIIMSFLSFSRYFLLPNSKYGIAEPTPIRDFLPALQLSDRKRIVFVNNGLTGGMIDEAIDTLASTGEEAGKEVVRLSNSDTLPVVCKSSLRAVSECYGAVEFHSSPDEGDGGIWNYTLRMDGGIGFTIDATSHDNDHEIYILPFQKAVDTTITSLSGGENGTVLPDTIDEYAYTDLTPEEREDYIRQRYQSAVQDYVAIAFILGIIGVVYHMTGFMATEREIGMSQLIEAMMPSRFSWSPQVIRLVSNHLAFSLLYLPCHVLGALITWRGLFVDSGAGILVLYFILVGFSFTSMSILGAAFFKKSQLSGITVTIIALVLGIISQVMATSSDATVAVLSFFFAPCNFVYFLGWISRFQEVEEPANLSKGAPDSPWGVSGGVLYLFVIIQIVMYPLLGALVERWLYGYASKGRKMLQGSRAQEMSNDKVRLVDFHKIYRPSFFARLFGHTEVHAVKGLNMTAQRGQILALLGANASGKSTTLDAIAGTNRVSSGEIIIDGSGGLGIAPQKNVLWDELTVEEHIRIFNRLKAPSNKASKHEIRDLVTTVDLEAKRKARSKTLSGGQKRKLQLGMMLTGGSAVCCVDEVSSGLDPLSRRKIWDILLKERGNRTIIMTTHFLDEADLLADKIVVLSKGSLRASGSSVELKESMGSGYRIHLHGARSLKSTPDIEGVMKKESFDVISYIAPSSAQAAQVIKALEAGGLTDYRFSGPTIEDVFLQLAEEAHGDGNGGVLGKPGSAGDVNEKGSDTNSAAGKDRLELLPGKKIGFIRQAGVLFLKRAVIFKSNWLIYLAAFLIPIIAAGLTTLFITDEEASGCSPITQSSNEQSEGIASILDDVEIVGGPSDKLSLGTLAAVFLPIFGDALGSVGGDSSDASNVTASFLDNFHFVDTYDEFTSYIEANRKNVTPGGLWLGDDNSNPTLAWEGTNGMFLPGYAQNALDMLLTNTTISSSTAIFDRPIGLNTGDSLQLLVYFGLALAAFPGFFALYPNIERRRNIRGLQYSNGVRSLPLWLAYLLFDFSIALVSVVIVVIIWATLSEIWYHVAYIFPVLMLYSLASVLLSYVISLFCGSQLSAYAFTSAGQAIIFLAYFLAYMCILTYSPVQDIDNHLLISHWTISLAAPIGSVTRALFVGLNIFSTACKEEELNPNPASMQAYGGPILYLVVQSLIYFLFLVWYDSGAVVSWFKRLRRTKTPDADGNPDVSDEEVAAELVRVTSSRGAAATRGADGRMSIPEAIRGDTAPTTDGLKVVHLTKRFGKYTAVDNVTFGIQRGEVFALLGPNGAGKSTVISLIRGDIQPSSRGGGDIFVEDISVTKQRAKARAFLGVCPQFDAVDSMTVIEHLRFYARIRGVEEVEHNVRAVIQAVGLQAFKDRMAGKLSGGNKRKLSLGIALMGNPTVVLLDEPSSGLDAAAKRVMWRTLARVSPGRSILLTTHSMEEADALAGRAGILSRRMLAMGTAEGLRSRWGNMLYVHLVCRGAPRTDDATVERIRMWIQDKFGDGADIDEKSWHGQMRFTLAASVVSGINVGSQPKQTGAGETDREITHASGSGTRGTSQQSALGKLVVMLEEEKESLGVEHFSVSPTTLDQVFLNIVSKHNVQEEGTEEKKKKRWWKRG